MSLPFFLGDLSFRFPVGFFQFQPFLKRRCPWKRTATRSAIRSLRRAWEHHGNIMGTWGLKRLTKPGMDWYGLDYYPKLSDRQTLTLMICIIYVYTYIYIYINLLKFETMTSYPWMKRTCSDLSSLRRHLPWRAVCRLGWIFLQVDRQEAEVRPKVW